MSIANDQRKAFIWTGAFKERLRAALAEDGTGDQTPVPQAGPFPQAFEDTVGALEAWVESGRSRAAMADAWYRQVSAGGFDGWAEPQHRPVLTLADRLCLRHPVIT